MATIWKQTHEGFVASPLQAAGGAAAGDGGEAGRTAKCPEFRVVSFRDGPRPSHALIADVNVPVRVNGSVVVGGIRVLQHKDELVAGSQRMLFSAESTPVIEVYRHDGSQRRPRCPVCRAEMQDGQSIVRCPGCSRIHHQITARDHAPAKQCWTYSPECRFCAHPTSLSGVPSWRPDEDEQP